MSQLLKFLLCILTSVFLLACESNDNEDSNDKPSNTGNTAETAVLSFIPASPYDFGVLSVGSDVGVTFTVTNTGAAVALNLNATGLTAPFQFTGGSYPGTSGTCASSLADGASCNLDLSFAPSTTGTFADSLLLEFSGGQGALNLQGTGTLAAVLSISDGPVFDYGTVSTGSNADHSFVLSNSGASTASSFFETGLSAPFSFQGGSFPGTGGTCSGNLAAGASCTFVIRASPTSSGVFNDSIEFNYFDGIGTQMTTRDLSVTGL